MVDYRGCPWCGLFVLSWRSDGRIIKMSQVRRIGEKMKLIIDGIATQAVADKSLYEMCEDMGLFTGKLSQDPLAAKIAGRVFTLNYIPLRTKDINERESIRRAMLASDGVIRLQRYRDRLDATFICAPRSLFSFSR